MTQRFRVMDEDLRPSFFGFHDLMSWRVERILLVASLYDSFVLEEDGRLTERIFSDYRALSLNSPPPRVTPVRSVAKALDALDQGDFDLVVTMLRLPDRDTASFIRMVKQRHPEIPVTVLSWDGEGLERRLGDLRAAGLDRAFLWSGDTSIFLALVKLMEDQANLEADVENADIRIVIVVEDSVRYYSKFLPMLYREVMLRAQALIDEGLNDFHKLYRVRARPKIVLASTFEQAVELFERYPENVLGFLSDIRFPRGGVENDPDAGFELVKAVRQRVPDIPFLLLSAEGDNWKRAKDLETGFLDKNSPTLVPKVRKFLKRHLGLGKFVFRTPDGRVEGEAANIGELITLLETVSDEALSYHALRNHFSHWLAARGEFALSRRIRPTQLRDFDGNIAGLRADLIRRINRSQDEQQRGVIADLTGRSYDPARTFARLGSGSLGGKSRSIAFLGALLERAGLEDTFPNVRFGVPRTVAIGSYTFEKFVEENDLEWVAGADLSDAQVAAEFLKGNLPEDIKESLARVLEVVRTPLAVRSSSLLEDSPDQPFSGVFSTYMLPNNHSSMPVRLYQLCRAVKLVYASTWFEAARRYLKATGHRPIEQNMGVAIQQVVGRRYGDFYYPCFSGVAQTHNFYPVRHLRPEDGAAIVALGLGRTITDGGTALRFSPGAPEVLPQLAVLDKVMDVTQREFWAVDLSNPNLEVGVRDDQTLVQLDINEAEAHGTLASIGSVLDVQDRRLKDGITSPGPRIISFAPVLKWKLFPLARILTSILLRAEDAMAGPAEIEFSGVLKGGEAEFQLLQIRPLTVLETSGRIDLDSLSNEDKLAQSGRALGHGKVDVLDLVYVKPETFDRTSTEAMVPEIERCNEVLLNAQRPYVLIGPGRWGTADPFVGIPVRWDQVCAAKVIVEADLPGFEIEPSQGSHFFHNLTAFNVFLLSISFRKPGEVLDWEWLAAQPAAWEGQYVRRLRLASPLRALLDGRRSRGVILKPKPGDQSS